MNLMCFTDFGYRKFLCIRGVGHDFLSELFVSQHKKIIGVHFSVSEILWYRKNFWINRVGGVSRVSVRNFLSNSAEKNRT